MKRENFTESICQECGICKDDKSKKHDFCYMVYQLRPKEFVNRVVKVGLIVDRSDVLSRSFLRSPEGFMELICHKDFCPAANDKCEDPKQKMVCYHYWTHGHDTKIPQDAIDKLVLSYQKQSIESINGGQLRIDKAWSLLPKKKRKKVKKTIKRLLQGFFKKDKKKNKQNNHKAKDEKKEVTTTIFYNDNENWIGHLKTIVNI